MSIKSKIFCAQLNVNLEVSIHDDKRLYVGLADGETFTMNRVEYSRVSAHLEKFNGRLQCIERTKVWRDSVQVQHVYEDRLYGQFYLDRKNRWNGSKLIESTYEQQKKAYSFISECVTEWAKKNPYLFDEAQEMANNQEIVRKKQKIAEKQKAIADLQAEIEALEKHLVA